jgi:hypothetical protein
MRNLVICAGHPSSLDYLTTAETNPWCLVKNHFGRGGKESRTVVGQPVLINYAHSVTPAKAFYKCLASILRQYVCV